MTTMVQTGPSAVPVFHHRWVAYRRNWRGSVFSSFLLPVLFLVGLGVTVGTYVDAKGALGLPYRDFVAPGLLASAVLQIAVGESSYPVHAGFAWLRTYFAMSASPLRARDMVGGEILYIWLRTGTSAVAFTIVLTLFGTVHSWYALATLPICLLLAVATAAPVIAFSSTVRTDNMFALLFRFAMIPMTLFAGVYFPVSQLPEVARWVAYLTPLWHGVELCRSATLGIAPPWPIEVHVGYLVLWAVGGYWLACRQFAKRLVS